MLSRGETILVLESGLFAVAWGDMARMLGVKVEMLKGDLRRAVDPAAVEQRLRADAARRDQGRPRRADRHRLGRRQRHRRHPPRDDAAGHRALLMVDCVASLGCMPFDMDGWGVDVAMSGSQKGLMTPPGLAFVAANERANAVHQKADLRTRYWDWTFRQGEAHYQKYGGTPPEHLLFGLRKALDLLLAEGLEASVPPPRAPRRGDPPRGRPLGGGRRARFNVTEPAERANSVTTVLVQGRDPRPLLDYCRENCGVVLGVGIGELSGKAFRIAHMGHVNAPMLFGTLGASRWVSPPSTSPTAPAASRPRSTTSGAR